MKIVFLKIIRVYQTYISPDHSKIGKALHPYGFCRFHPTCSQYTYQAIEKYGILKGSFMGTKRIFRCNPWNKGGIDPVK